MAGTPKLCVLTIHGIGFQQPPDDQHDGYAVTDLEVDNLTYSSGGGLQAHNYWDNTTQFIPALARLLGGAG
jgi:hypothetical protein